MPDLARLRQLRDQYRAIATEQDRQTFLETINRLHPFTRAYIEAGLWTCNTEEDDRDTALDEKYDIRDIDPGSLKVIIQECNEFMARHHDQIFLPEFDRERAGSQAGHYFWLTRCGHGANFLDGVWPEPIRRQLYEAAGACRNVHLFEYEGTIYYENC